MLLDRGNAKIFADFFGKNIADLGMTRDGRSGGEAFALGRPMLGQQLVILGVIANPEPLNSISDWNAKRSVVNADSDTAVLAVTHRLEMQRSMRRVMTEKSIVPARKLLYVNGQGVEATPKMT